MPMTHDNVFNLEQYSKGYVYGICNSHDHDPASLRASLRTLLRFVCDVISSRWEVAPSYLQDEITSEIASIVNDPTAFAVLALKPFEHNEARYFLLKACVDEIIATQCVTQEEYAPAVDALRRAFAALPMTTGPSIFACLLREFDDSALYFLASIPFSLILMSWSYKLDELMTQKNGGQPSDNALQPTVLDEMISYTRNMIYHQKNCLNVVFAAIMLKILIKGYLDYRNAGTRPRLATAPTLMHNTAAQPPVTADRHSSAMRPSH